MGKILFHIGNTKTGTSSLQKALYSYKERLNDRGISYPDFGHYSHNILVQVLFGQQVYLKNRKRVEKWLAEKNAGKHEKETSILSAEAVFHQLLWTTPKPNADDLILNKLKKLKDGLGNRPIHFILYLRRFDDWWESEYRQNVQLGKHHKHISQMAKYAITFDHKKVLQKIVDYFGVESITIRPYERDQLIEGDILKDFLNCTGILDLVDVFSDVSEQANPTISSSLIAVQRSLNETRSGFHPLVLEKASIKLKERRTFMLDYESRSKILDKFRSEYEWISDQFLNGKFIFHDYKVDPTIRDNLFIEPDKEKYYELLRILVDTKDELIRAGFIEEFKGGRKQRIKSRIKQLFRLKE